MKIILLVISLLVSPAAYSQVLNGSFENGSASDLSFWEWTCGADSLNIAPPGGGNWCIRVSGGNFKSCFPSYTYQKIPLITSGQTYLLSGWAYAESSPTAGIYFGVINNGIISLQAGDTTSSAEWSQLSVESDFALAAGDTAVVVLFSGTTGGPLQGYGYFDLIDLQLVTSINSKERKQSLTISPNPFSTQTTFYSNNILKEATLTICNSYGQTIKQVKNISGQIISFNRDNLPSGLYLIQLAEDGIITTGKIIIVD
ncbi:MAG: T9SS type A sorting domain-containing protein [Saprospiraceae bacterium]|nr:T9SS type A sorting domain-containing protein [Saprospiraceae bacterium]